MLETNYVVLEYERVNVVKGLKNFDLCVCFHLTLILLLPGVVLTQERLKITSGAKV